MDVIKEDRKCASGGKPWISSGLKLQGRGGMTKAIDMARVGKVSGNWGEPYCTQENSILLDSVWGILLFQERRGTLLPLATLLISMNLIALVINVIKNS